MSLPMHSSNQSSIDSLKDFSTESRRMEVLCSRSVIWSFVLEQQDFLIEPIEWVIRLAKAREVASKGLTAVLVFEARKVVEHGIFAGKKWNVDAAD